MRITEETVTPDQAAQWLRKTEGTVQRTISEKQVDKLTGIIRDGQWELTHQAIAISPDGVVIDGRHRLSAIVKSNTAVPLMVAREADPSTFQAIDTGRTRKPADLLHIAGFHNTNALAAAVRFIIAAKRVAGTQDSWSPAINSVRNDQVIDFATRNHAELDHALAIGGRTANALGRFGLRTLLSTAVYLIRESTVPTDLQNEFFDRLNDGTMLTAGSPILALRRYLMGQLQAHPNAVKGPVGLGVTLKAFNSYVAGEKVQLSVFRLGSERFPGVKPWQPGVSEIEEHIALPSERENEVKV